MKPEVLVVDDEPGVCWALEYVLTRSGFEVTTAYTGEEVVFLLEDHTYEVAFVDAKLPDIDGMQLASEMARLDARPAVVLISGYYYGEDRAVQGGLEAGLIIGFIAKPFSLEEVREMVKVGVDVSQQRKVAIRT